MTTVTKNNITINFKNRLLSTLRWRLLDALSRNKSFTNLKSTWMCCLQELVDHVYNYLTNEITLLDKIEQVNKKYILDIIPLKILALFRDDVEMFAVIVFPSLGLINQYNNDYIASKQEPFKSEFKKYKKLSFCSEDESAMVDNNNTVTYTTDEQTLSKFLKKNPLEIIHWK